MVRFLRILFYKAFAPSLGASQMWTKRNDYAPKCEYADFFFCICPGREVLKNNLSLTILLSCIVFIFSFPKNISLKFYFDNIFLSWAPIYFFLLEHLFYVSHCKTHWTMLMDNIGLKLCLLGTSNYMVIMTFFFLV